MIKNSGNFKGAGLKALDARIRALGQQKLVVGVPASAGRRQDGLNNATIAAAHEFGVPGHIPERSFLRSTLSENSAQASRLLANRLQQAIFEDGETKAAFALVGEKLAGEVKRKIQSGLAPPLNPKTIARKGSSTPLIDSGNLLQSITYEVRNK